MNSNKVEMLAEEIERDFNNSEERFTGIFGESLILDNPQDLIRAMTTHCSKFSFYSMAFTLMKQISLKAEQDIEDFYNKMLNQFREQDLALKKPKTHQLTETALKNLVYNLDDYKKLKRRWIDCKTKEGLIGNMVEMYKHKKDMLWNLASNQRTEMNNLHFGNPASFSPIP